MNTVSEFECTNNKSKLHNFLSEIANEFLIEMEVTKYYGELSIDLTFHKEKIEKVLSEIYDEIRNEPLNSETIV